MRNLDTAIPPRHAGPPTGAAMTGPDPRQPDDRRVAGNRVPPLARPRPTAGPRIGASRTGVTTIRGTVTEGVEPGCIVLIDDSGAALANLQGWNLQAHPFDSVVTVTGVFQPDLMTTSQQGTPFDVRSVVTE